MNEDKSVLIGMLKMAYAKKNGLDIKNNLSEQLNDFLPVDWDELSQDDKIKALDEAIKNNILVENTEIYKNFYPKDV